MPIQRPTIQIKYILEQPDNHLVTTVLKKVKLLPATNILVLYSEQRNQKPIYEKTPTIGVLSDSHLNGRKSAIHAHH